MVDFIDRERGVHGVEPICEVLQIAPSTYYRHKHLQSHPEEQSVRFKRDEALKPEIERVYEENHRVYGARKVWKQLQRECIPAARCTVERLMRIQGLRGVRRGKRCVTTIPDALAEKPLDLVNRRFVAERPNQLWVADIPMWRPGSALYMWPLLSMSSRVTSWAGEFLRAYRPISFWMHLSKPCGREANPKE